MVGVITDIKETQRIIGTYLKPNYTPQLGKSKKKKMDNFFAIYNSRNLSQDEKTI